MATFVDSCFAKDRHGEVQRFFVGQKVRLRRDDCPQINLEVDVVRSCFYQNTTVDSQHGMAVLLTRHSWDYCRNLEIA